MNTERIEAAILELNEQHRALLASTWVRGAPKSNDEACLTRRGISSPYVSDDPVLFMVRALHSLGWDVPDDETEDRLVACVIVNDEEFRSGADAISVIEEALRFAKKALVEAKA